MGLKFKKSFKVAPGVKVNLNKKSMGVTVGGKHAKVTMNSKGKRTTTISAPGTGLSYSTTSGGTKKKRTTSGNTSTKATASINSNSAIGYSSDAPKKSVGVPLPVLLGVVGGAVFLFVAFIVFVFVMAKISPNNEPVDSLEAQVVTANDFAAKFSENKNSANTEYKNNVFEVTGEFKSIEENKVIISSDVVSDYSKTYDLSFVLAEGQSVPNDVIPGCPVTIKGRFNRISMHTLTFNGCVFISQGEIELFDVYYADELAHLIDEDDDFEESLKGKYIQITGEVKENKLSDDEIYILGDFKYGGWYQCEMLDELEVNDAEPGDIATIQGRVTNILGHCKMDYCKLISSEEPSTEPTTEAIVTEAPTSNQIIMTDPPIKRQTTYWINTESRKFHYSDCRTIKDKTESYWSKRTGNRKDLIGQGYSPCGACDP